MPVTVKDLAKKLKIQPLKLLESLQEFGMRHESEDAEISDADKKKLLLGMQKKKSRRLGVNQEVSVPKSYAETKLERNQTTSSTKPEQKTPQEAEADELEPAEDEQSAEGLHKPAKTSKSTTKNKPETSSDETKYFSGKMVKSSKKIPSIRSKSSAKKTDSDKKPDTKSDKSKSDKAASKKATPPMPGVADKTAPEPQTEKKKKGKKSKQAKSRGVDEDEDIIKSPQAKKSKTSGVEEVQERSIVRVANLHGFQQPLIAEKLVELDETSPILVAELASLLSLKSIQVIKALMKMGVMASINQAIDADTAVLVCEELGFSVKLKEEVDIEDALFTLETQGKKETRPPIVTIMGHVDHGKTSLLDHIRKTKVAEGEAGGITQHIGAYTVEGSKGRICFLDTPGHAAFTAMRARGSQVTDVVILVVAADDGVMPQTKESIHHAQLAEVPVIVAITKIDKTTINLEKIKTQLSENGLTSEEWGGETIILGVSSHTGEGIDELLDAVSLVSEMRDLQAHYTGRSKGVIIEARLDKLSGVQATLIVQDGVLNKGDVIVIDDQIAKVRRMMDSSGRELESADPASVVVVSGMKSVPEPGMQFVEVQDERVAQDYVQKRQEERDKRKAAEQSVRKVGSFEEMLNADGSPAKKRLYIIIKADVRGSLEALQSLFLEKNSDELEIQVLLTGVGGITETDINLAISSNAMLVAFNVRADKSVRDLAENKGVVIRYHSIIYEAIEDLEKMMLSMSEPEEKEIILGLAEVREVFSSPKFGQVAGCIVAEGKIKRNAKVRVLRDNVVIFEGAINSLRRFKDNVAEVNKGVECGIGIQNYKDIKAGDRIENFELRLSKEG